MKKHYERTGEIKISIDYKKKGVRQVYKNLVFKSEKELENFLLTL